MPGGDGIPLPPGGGGCRFAPIVVAQHCPRCITAPGSWAGSGRAAPHAVVMPTVALGSPSLWHWGGWQAGNRGPGSYLVWQQQGRGGWAELAEGPVAAPSQRCKIKEAHEGPGKPPAIAGWEQLLGPRGTSGGHRAPRETPCSCSPAEPNWTIAQRGHSVHPCALGRWAPQPMGAGMFPHPTGSTPLPAELPEAVVAGGPGDSTVLASPALPGVAMVSPNYSSSARTAWVHGEAAGAAALRGAGGTGTLQHGRESRAPAKLRAPSAHRGGRARAAPLTLPVPLRSHLSLTPSPFHRERISHPLCSPTPWLVGTRCPTSPSALSALGGHQPPCPGSPCCVTLRMLTPVGSAFRPTELPARQPPPGGTQPLGAQPAPGRIPSPGRTQVICRRAPCAPIAEQYTQTPLPSVSPPAGLRCCRGAPDGTPPCQPTGLPHGSPCHCCGAWCHPRVSAPLSTQTCTRHCPWGPACSWGLRSLPAWHPTSPSTLLCHT